MKKLFAMLLVMTLLISSFPIRAVAAKPEPSTFSAEDTNSDATFEETMDMLNRIISAEAGYDSKAEKQAEREYISKILTRRILGEKADDSTSETTSTPDCKLTLEMIQEATSWKEFVDMVLPIDDNIGNIENQEDMYCVIVISGINRTRTSPVDHDTEYVSVGFGGIRIKEVNLIRLLEKIYAIINLYNEHNDLTLTLKSQKLGEEIMQVDVKSTNLNWLEQPAQYIGQKVQLKEGTTYWESSWNDGSGKCAVATDDNSYIPEDYIVTVTGVAYLDDNWKNVTESYYTPFSNCKIPGPSIRRWERHLLHISTETTDLGWVYAENVMRVG